MSVYKLTYFDHRLRGELSRLLFVYQGQKFEDIRIRPRDWPTYKSSTRFGKVPVLEIDGKSYTESVAINNYLANQFGLYGKTALDRLEIDQVVGKTQDLWIYIIDWVHAILDKTGKAEELKTIILEVRFPQYLKIFQELLTANGTGFYVGKELTYADIAVFDILDSTSQDLLLEQYPKVKVNRDMVRDHPRLRDYIASRKPSKSRL